MIGSAVWHQRASHWIITRPAIAHPGMSGAYWSEGIGFTSVTSATIPLLAMNRAVNAPWTRHGEALVFSRNTTP